MNAQRFLHTIDGISTWFGKAAAWLIMGLMALVCAEVFKRYILNMPTAWIFDASNMLYGTLFMSPAPTRWRRTPMSAATSSTVRCGRARRPLDLVLYIVFFLPGIAALAYAGWDYASVSYRINEHSNVTADGPPVYHFKFMIPLAGALLLLQGAAEIMRCVICLKTGVWPSRLKDVSEIDVVEEQLAHSEHVDEESRREAIAHAANIEESARQRGMGGDLQR